jgi:hypothetical protein
MNPETLTKNQAQVIGFITFVLIYVSAVNLWLHASGSESLVFVPGTLLFGLIGYWLWGYLYSKYITGEEDQT